MRTRVIIWAVLTIFLSVLTGCSSATLKTSSKSSQFTGKVNKVYIVGFSQEQDTRQLFENIVAETLAEHGVTGIASYQDQPILSEINDETIEESVKATGADSLLLTLATGLGTISGADIIQPNAYRYELINLSQSDPTYPQPYRRSSGNAYYVPQRDEPYGFYPRSAFSEFHAFGDPNRRVTYTPFNKYETVIIQTYLFDTQTKELIWSAELEAKKSDPSTSIADFIDIVTGDLKKQGLI